MTMTKGLKLFAFSAAAAFLFGCSSSDSGGSTPSPTTKGISGIVIDPPIKDARIELKNAGGVTASFCGANANLVCQDFSGEDGTFTIFVPINEDLSGYYLVTSGGVDTVYGTDFLGISLYSPLSLFEGGNKSVIISPITSLAANLVINESETLQAAVTATAEALGLTESEVSLSPLDNAALLKASYLVAKTAEFIHNEGAADPFAKIAAALAAKPSYTIDQDGFLYELFDLSGITETGVITSLKGEVQSLKTRLAYVPDYGTTDEIAKLILNAERKALFVEAVKSAVGAVSPTDALFVENVTQLYDKLAGLVDNLPTNQFAANQLVRFVIYQDSFFGSDSSYTDPDFGTKLDALIPSDEEDKAEFITSIAAISKESIYFVSAPLGEPLGDNNTKRVNYYFKSNADVNYKAKTLISGIFADDVNDTIYRQVIASYAANGYSERAAEFARAYIVTNRNRTLAFLDIIKYAGFISKAEGLKYLPEARALLEARRATGTIDGDLVSDYTALAERLVKIGAWEESTEVREFILSDIIEKIPDGATPSKYTVNTVLYNNIFPIIEDLIAARELEQAEAITDYYVRMIKAGPPANNALPTVGDYANHFTALARVMLYYHTIALLLNDPAKTDTLKVKVADAYEAVKYFKSIERSAYVGWKGTGYYGAMPGHVYWALDYDTAFNEVLTPISGNAQGYSRGFMELFTAMAWDNFESAVTFYETNRPLDTDYNNINLQTGYEWLKTFTYFNSSAPGLAAYSISVGNYALAEKALDYILVKMDEASNYFISNNVTGKLAGSAIGMVTSNNTLNIFPSDVRDGRAWEEGYLRIAEVYLEIGKPEKAKTALDQALYFAENCADAASFGKSKAYAAIGHYYNLAGYASEAEAAFDKAIAVGAAGTDTQKADYYIGIAYDRFFRQTVDKNAIITDLESAASHAAVIAAAFDKVLRYILIARIYNELLDIDAAKNALALAVTDSATITSTTNKDTRAKQIFAEYSKFELIDIAEEKLVELYPALGDKAKAYGILAKEFALCVDTTKTLTERVGRDDFPNHDIAVLDTDKDGKPDFFFPWATEDQITASGLVLDEDIDGDGILDDADLRPFFKDN